MGNWYPLSFDSDGNSTTPAEIDGPDGITEALTNQHNAVTDLWILSFGWNVSQEDGKVFYDTWVNLLRTQIQQANLQNYHPMFIGIFWPSEVFANIGGGPNPAPAPVSGLGDRANFIQAYRPILDPEQKKPADVFAQDFGAVYDFISAQDITDKQKVSTFLATLKKYQQEDPHADQPLIDNVIDTGADALAPFLITSLNEVFPGKIGDGLLAFLRVFSFWTMKGRAGTVGANGLAPVLATFRTTTLQNDPPLRIHLMGHSFGAKLLTSAVFKTASLQNVLQPVVNTLILFQGAFSQFSFSSNIPNHQGLTGFYANVVAQGMVSTPVTVMYSTKDLANNTLYPIGMAPILSYGLIVTDPFPPDPNSYQKSDELRGSVGANGVQGFADLQMYNVALPWPDINPDMLNAISCININRTPFFDPTLDVPPIGIHNDYHEPEIFQAAFAISQF